MRVLTLQLAAGSMSNNKRSGGSLEGEISSLISRVSVAFWDVVGCCSIVLLVLAILFFILSGIRCN